LTAAGSYDAGRAHRDRESELSRLRAQVDLSWEKEAARLVDLGLSDGASILEVGSGPGFYTQRLAQRFPGSAITCVDIDASLLAEARRLLAGNPRLRFVEAPAESTSLPGASFDFAVARMLFQHLPDPVAAAREIGRLLKPGGRAAILDVDDDLLWILDPAPPNFEQLRTKLGEAQASHGGNRRVGRRLWRILSEAGLRPLSLDSVLIHSDESGLAAFAPQLDPGMLLPLVNAGLLAREQFEAITAGENRFLSDPESIVMMNFLLAAAEKPGPP
jgi:ubiquinone/menaquinone biosynthesis C-methylase UbiE